jgi:hypothetical protein
LGFSLSSWLRVAREGGFVVAGQVAVALAGLIGIRLLTELAPGHVFGEASLLMGLLMLGRNLFLAPFYNVQLKFHPEYGARGQGTWFTEQMAFYAGRSLICVLALGVPLYALWRWTEGGFRPLLLAVLAIILLLDNAKNLRLGRYNAERRQARSAAWAVAEALMAVILGAAALWCSTTTEAYLLGQAAAAGIVLGIFVHLAPALPQTGAGPNSA